MLYRLLSLLLVANFILLRIIKKKALIITLQFSPKIIKDTEIFACLMILLLEMAFIESLELILIYCLSTRKVLSSLLVVALLL